MGRPRPYIPHHDIPFDLELRLLEMLRLSRTGFARKHVRSEGVRNEILAAVLEEKNLILPDALQSASDDPHGTDALMFWGPPDEHGVVQGHPCEIKTCIHPDPLQDPKKFEYHEESIKTYERLINEHQLLATYRPCPDGLDRVVEVYLLRPGSLLHQEWQRRLDEIRSIVARGEKYERKRLSYSLKKIRDLYLAEKIL